MDHKYESYGVEMWIMAISILILLVLVAVMLLSIAMHGGLLPCPEPLCGILEPVYYGLGFR